MYVVDVRVKNLNHCLLSLYLKGKTLIYKTLLEYPLKYISVFRDRKNLARYHPSPKKD
jgi:hypothetical protein